MERLNVVYLELITVLTNICTVKVPAEKLSCTRLIDVANNMKRQFARSSSQPKRTAKWTLSSCANIKQKKIMFHSEFAAAHN